MVEITEQWLREGDCELCRRKKFCSKICKAHARRVHSQIQSMATAIAFQCYKDMVTRKRD